MKENSFILTEVVLFRLAGVYFFPFPLYRCRLEADRVIGEWRFFALSRFYRRFTFIPRKKVGKIYDAFWSGFGTIFLLGCSLLFILKTCQVLTPGVLPLFIG